MKIRRNLFGRVGVSNYSRTREKKEKKKQSWEGMGRGSVKERRRKLLILSTANKRLEKVRFRIVACRISYDFDKENTFRDFLFA